MATVDESGEPHPAAESPLEAASSSSDVADGSDDFTDAVTLAVPSVPTADTEPEAGTTSLSEDSARSGDQSPDPSKGFTGAMSLSDGSYEGMWRPHAAACHTIPPDTILQGTTRLHTVPQNRITFSASQIRPMQHTRARAHTHTHTHT